MTITGRGDSFKILANQTINSDVHDDHGSGPDTNTTGPLIVSQVNGTPTSSTGPIEITTAQGARVRMNQDGTFTYDPSVSAVLTSLAFTAFVLDTFTYQNQGSGEVVLVVVDVQGIVGRPVITGTSGADSRTVTDIRAQANLLEGNDELIYEFDPVAYSDAEVDGGTETDTFVLIDRSGAPPPPLPPTGPPPGAPPGFPIFPPGPRFNDADLVTVTMRNFENFEVRYTNVLNTADTFLIMTDLQAQMFQNFIGPAGIPVNITVLMDSLFTLSLENKTFQAGSDFRFTIRGQGDAETLTGSTRGDTIDGAGGNDSLDGGPGNDVLIGGPGADTLNGGDQIDTADYSGSLSGVFVYLSGTDISGNPITNRGGDAEGDTLTNVENLIGSFFRDDLFGDADANAIYGGGGRDFVFGLGGADSLFGGDNLDFISGVDGGVSDYMDGGPGRDVAYYYTATGSQIVNMTNHTDVATNSGEHIADTWVNISGFWGARDHANTLTGDSNANDLLGGEQGDVIYGGAGTDQLLGRGGNDQIFGGSERDLILAGSGTDSLTGGPGIDTFYVLTGDGKNIITDFVEGEDLFYFVRTGVTGFTDLTFTDTGTDVEITSARDTSFRIVVQNVEVTDLDQLDANGQAITTFGFA